LLALVTQPGTAHTARVAEVPAVRAGEGEVLLRSLEVGVCGTDREIAAGRSGHCDCPPLLHALRGV
jgi:threonine dehydrogenase-like Zn-dependent dehydrogenase